MLALEAQTDEAIPLEKVDRRRRIARLNAHYRAVHFGRRSKVVSANLQRNTEKTTEPSSVPGTGRVRT